MNKKDRREERGTHAHTHMHAHTHLPALAEGSREGMQR